MKSKRYYNEKAAYLRQLAREAQTEALKKSCLSQAEIYEDLARKADEKTADQE